MEMEQVQIMTMEQEQPEPTIIYCKNPYCAHPHEVTREEKEAGTTYTDSWGDEMLAYRWTCEHCKTEHTERGSVDILLKGNRRCMLY